MTTTARVGLLELTQSPAADGLTLKLTGQADTRDSADLTHQLLTTHTAALAASAQSVRVDVREVEFMNSTALGAFVSWVSELRKVEIAKRYRIIFQGSTLRRWQRGSLHALAAFAPDHISVELA